MGQSLHCLTESSAFQLLGAARAGAEINSLVVTYLMLRTLALAAGASALLFGGADAQGQQHPGQGQFAVDSTAEVSDGPAAKAQAREAALEMRLFELNSLAGVDPEVCIRAGPPGSVDSVLFFSLLLFPGRART